MYRLGEALRVTEVSGSQFQNNRHKKVVSLSALNTGRLYPLQEIFQVLLSAPEMYRFKRRSNNDMATNEFCIVPSALFTTLVVTNKLHYSLQPLNFRPGQYILMQKAVMLNTCPIAPNFLTE